MSFLNLVEIVEIYCEIKQKNLKMSHQNYQDLLSYFISFENIEWAAYVV